MPVTSVEKDLVDAAQRLLKLLQVLAPSDNAVRCIAESATAAELSNAIAAALAFDEGGPR